MESHEIKITTITTRVATPNNTHLFLRGVKVERLVKFPGLFFVPVVLHLKIRHGDQKIGNRYKNDFKKRMESVLSVSASTIASAYFQSTLCQPTRSNLYTPTPNPPYLDHSAVGKVYAHRAVGVGTPLQVPSRRRAGPAKHANVAPQFLNLRRRVQ